MFLGNDSQGQHITFINSSENLRGKAGAGAGHTGSLGWGSGEQQNQGEMTALRAAQSENQLELDGGDEKGREG